METTLQILSIILGTSCIISVIHYRYIEQVNLFELDDGKLIADALKWFPDEFQARIYACGSMTRHQWQSLRQAQMREFDAALGSVNGSGPALLAQSST